MNAGSNDSKRNAVKKGGMALILYGALQFFNLMAFSAILTVTQTYNFTSSNLVKCNGSPVAQRP